MRKGRKIVFVLGLVGRVSVCSHYCSEIQDFPHAAARAKKHFCQSDLLTPCSRHSSPSACSVEIWSTLTYTEFDCVALLAML